MPIKDKSAYPPNWKQIRAAILKRDAHACKLCGAPNYAVGYRLSGGAFHIIKQRATRQEAKEAARIAHQRGQPEHIIWIVLTIAHLDHDTQNNDPSNLAALCQMHHLRHDAALHAAHAAETRRQKQISLGQSSLLEQGATGQ